MASKTNIRKQIARQIVELERRNDYGPVWVQKLQEYAELAPKSAGAYRSKTFYAAIKRDAQTRREREWASWNATYSVWCD